MNEKIYRTGCNSLPTNEIINVAVGKQCAITDIDDQPPSPHNAREISRQHKLLASRFRNGGMDDPHESHPAHASGSILFRPLILPL